MSTPFTKLRKIARKQTIGKRTHLWEHTNPRVKHYQLGPMEKIPFQTYTFSVHPETTRGTYLTMKKQLKRELQAAKHANIRRRYVTGFGSRARTRGQDYGPKFSQYSASRGQRLRAQRDG